MQTFTRLSLVICLASAGFLGCKKDDSKAAAPPAANPAASPSNAPAATRVAPHAAPATPAAPTPHAAPATPAAPAAARTQGKPATDPGGPVGTVLETMQSGGYSYALLDTSDGKMWVAGPQVPLEVGQKVAAVNGMVMTDFHSKTLNRTFPRIMFAASFKRAVPGGQAAAAAAPKAAATATTKNPPAATGAMATAIAPATGGKRVSQVFAEKSALAGQTVAVRGEVVKFNPNILGNNWIHLQDGSGTAGTNDLTVTTSATAKVGDIVTVRGTVSLNRDFGAGYNYPLILENATVEAK